jgi:aspartyl-tRNA(Asn)/glutamyl-tRNA(Gln) amidotransferase subunit B
MTELLRKLKDDARRLAEIALKPAQLAELIRLVDAGTISGRIGKDVFERIWASGESPLAIVEREGLLQVSDSGAIEAMIADVVAASPDQVAAYKAGKASTLGWFVGQVMKKTGGKANPQLVNELLKKALEEGP